MRFDGRLFVTIAAVALLSFCAICIADNGDAASEKTVSVYAEVDGEVVEMTGTGADLQTAIRDAAEKAGYPVDLGPANIISFNEQKAPSGKYWTVQQWIPPRGWQVVTFNKASANFVEGTSYFLYLAERTTVSGYTTYTSPEFEPEAKAYFYIQFKEDVNANSYVTSILTEKQRTEGFWIAGTGSNAAWAFKDACEKLGFELNMSDGVKGDIVDYDYIGWLNSFLGLDDVLISGSTQDGSWKYWSQFYWDENTGSWVYGETMGHYDPGVVKYFALVRQITDSDKVDTTLDQTPSDAPLNNLNGTCTVRFIDGNGSVISTQNVQYFGAATAPDNPSKNPSAGVTYTFVGWDKEFDQVISDLTVTARFTASGTTPDPDPEPDPEPSDVPVTGVKIIGGLRQLVTGDTTTLSARITPFNATDTSVTWSTSDSNVVTIGSDGVVTAVASGTATITVTASNGITATCVITVSKVPVNSVSLSSSSLTLEIGKTDVLDVTVSPDNANDKRVVWTSSNPSVATVADGKIMAVGVGSAIITATAADGSGVSASCTVTVNGILVSSIILDNDSLSLKVGEESTLVATVSPDDAYNKKVIWTSSNPSVATVSDGTIIALKAGTVIITATAADGSGVSASCSVTITERVESILLSSSFLAMQKGDSVKLIVTPGNVPIDWSSSDTSVATVDSDGTVTVVSDSGSAVITADAGEGITASCTVTSITKDDVDAIITTNLEKNDEGIYKVEFTESHMSALKTADKGYTLNTAIGSVTLSEGVLETIGSEGNIIISVANLNRAQASVIGNIQAYEYRLNDGNISKLGGVATISIPYALKEGESADNLYVYHIDSSGNLERFDCTYENGYAVFDTTHFSVYFATTKIFESSPTTDDGGESSGSDTMLYVAVIAVVLVVAAAAAVLIRRRG